MATFEDPKFLKETADPFVEKERAKAKSTRHSGPSQANGADSLRFRFTPFRNIELDTAPPYRVHELLPRVGVVVVWGKPKSGKTFWTYDLEMHVALGWDYHGRRVEQDEVLHIACEGVRGLGARKEAWRLHHIEGKSADEIAAIDNAPFHLCKDTALDLVKDIDQVMTDIAIQFGDRPLAVITIDTLNRSLRGSESKDEDMGAYISAAIALADKFQCCVIVIHHCGHNEDRPRGHSSLLGSADALIEIKTDDHGRVCSEVEEMRDGPNGAQTTSLLKVVNVAYDDNLDLITSCVIVPDDTVIKQPRKKYGSKPPQPLTQRFYEALTNAAADLAKIRSESFGKPSITEEQWIIQLEKCGLLEPLPPADKDKAAYRTATNRRSAAMSRHKAALIAANWIRCNDYFVWSIRNEY